MAIISIENLPEIRKTHNDKKIVFASGSFDLTHAGHVLFFEECKKYGDILVVMIGSDKVLKKLKGPDRPILNENLRIKLIDSLKPIDYCFLDELDPDEESHKLVCVNKAIEKLQPDVYVINEDAFDIPYREEMAKKNKIGLVILPRSAPPEFDSVSTSKIILKIKESK